MVNFNFEKRERPVITAMLYGQTILDIEREIADSISKGAQAFGLQINALPKEYQTGDVFNRIISLAGNRPIYCTNYRTNDFNRHMNVNDGATDEELMAGYDLPLACGISLVDVMGDTFAPNKYELTKDIVAIEKQIKLIEKIHKKGGKVLMSSHITEFLAADMVLYIALSQQERGADVVKIVTESNTEEQLLENLKTTVTLKRELNVPFIFISNGKYCRMHRLIGGMFGSCMALCVPYYQNLSSKVQPTIENAKAIMDNFNWDFYNV